MSAHTYTVHPLSSKLPPTSVLRKEPGIYRLIAVDERGTPKKIPRLADTDFDGILYMGKSITLRTRVSQMRLRIVGNNWRGHLTGDRYQASPRLMALLPKETLYFAFLHCDKCEDVERNALIKYVETFGELPPFNSALRL